MAHDVFISYAHPDKPTADAACARLEQRGIRCWIAPRDIKAGADWGASIARAIHDARALVLIFSDYANASSEVPKEVALAARQGISIITFRIQDVAPRGSLDYNLTSVHWLDALTPPVEAHLEHLVGSLRTVLQPGLATVEPEPSPVVPPRPTLRRLALVGAGVLGAVSVIYALSTDHQPSEQKPPDGRPASGLRAIGDSGLDRALMGSGPDEALPTTAVPPPATITPPSRRGPSVEPRTREAPPKVSGDGSPAIDSTAAGPDSVPDPDPPVTTATLEIASPLGGTTFVELNGDGVPRQLQVHPQAFSLPAGIVTLLITSNQPGCQPRTDSIRLRPGDRKTITRIANCPDR